ncbi:MAG TPA: hypothetical protein PLV89_06550 [Treponemataceae bacterium]|nr:hypothetical protein [Treponemataceae bacterium]
MKKQIFFWLLIIFCFSICVSQEFTPQIFLDRDFEVYLGLDVDEVKAFFSESCLETEHIFSEEKPEYNTIFWDTNSGLRVSFYKGKRQIISIVLTSDEYYIYYNGSRIIPFVTNLNDVINILGEGTELYNEFRNVRVLEYGFKKKEYNPLISDIIQIDFNDDNVVERISIFDTSRFI